MITSRVHVCDRRACVCDRRVLWPECSVLVTRALTCGHAILAAAPAEAIFGALALAAALLIWHRPKLTRGNWARSRECKRSGRRASQLSLPLSCSAPFLQGCVQDGSSGRAHTAHCLLQELCAVTTDALGSLEHVDAGSVCCVQGVSVPLLRCYCPPDARHRL